MTTILLIRHGESEANRQNVFAGHFNPDLQHKGILQAELTAKYIAENYKVDKIYSSDLTRAYKTAKSLGDLLGLEVIPDQRLREINAGKWEGEKYLELIDKYPEEFGLWLNDIGRATCPDGETVKQLGERVMEALTEFAKNNDGKTVAIGTHATPIRVTQSIIQTGGLEEMKTIPWVSNASVSVVEYNDGKWTMPVVSEDRHLADLKTELPQNV